MSAIAGRGLIHTPLPPAITTRSLPAVADALPKSQGVSTAPAVTPRDARRTLETRFPASLHIRRGDNLNRLPPRRHQLCRRSSGPVAAPTRGEARRAGRPARPHRRLSWTPTIRPTTRSSWLVRVFCAISIINLRYRDLTRLALPDLEKVIEHDYSIARALQITGNPVTWLARGATRG